MDAKEGFECASITDTAAAISTFLTVVSGRHPTIYLRLLDLYRVLGGEAEVSFRGEGAATFLLATKEEKSVELYPDGEKKIIVCADDEESYSSLEQVVARTRSLLN